MSSNDDDGNVVAGAILNQPPLLVSSNPPFLGSEEARQRPVDASAIAEADAIHDDVEGIGQDTIDAIHDVTDDDATHEIMNNNNNNNNQEEHKIWIHTYKLCYRYCY